MERFGGPICRIPGALNPGFERPVLVVQAQSFIRSRIQTVIVAAISSNLRFADAPGNVLLPARVTGLPRDSVVSVSQLLTVDRSYLTEHVGSISSRLQESVDAGLRLILDLLSSS